jgi:hypothetical protein
VVGNGTGNIQGHTCLRGRAVGLLGGLRLTSSRGFSCSPHDDDDILYSGAGRPEWTGLGSVGCVAVRAAKNRGKTESQMRSEAKEGQKSSAGAVCKSTIGQDGLRDGPGGEGRFSTSQQRTAYAPKLL